MKSRALTAIALLFASAALADDDPNKTVKYRAQVMSGVGAHMGASATIVKGEVGRVEDLKVHARAMADAATYFDQLFPKGTGPDATKTEALPKVWDDWEGFVKANDAFEEASKAFVEAAETGDMAKIKPAFGKLGKSCGGCHDNYKKDDDH